jgi:methenyltetrahydromethanopterin cyclohydrolase
LLSKENKTLLERIQFEEESDTAVLALETEKKPSESVVEQIAQSCSVSSENLYLIVFSKNSLAGALQASGQIVGLGMERLIQGGLDPLSVKYAWGYAPIATLHQNSTEFSERTKAAIMSSGVTSYIVDSQDESHLRRVLGQSHASALKMFLEAKSLSDQNPRYKDLLKETGMDQMNVEPGAIAPAVVTLRNFRTGMALSGGKPDFEALRRAIGAL